MARIYTRTGDTGQTGLADGSRVPKSDVRIEAYGTVDELNSWLGLLIAQCDQTDLSAHLTQVQSKLFDLGAQLATPKPQRREQMPTVRDADVMKLEQWVDQYEAELPPLRLFLLPGGSLLTAHLHVARTVCRRAERRLVALCEQDPSYPSELLRYMNRLSDLLFVLTRVVNQRTGIPETRWEPDGTE